MFAWCRKCLALLATTVVFGVGLIGWYVYWHYTDPETVRRLVVRAVHDALPGARVELASAEARLLGGLRLEDFAVSAPAQDGTQQETLRLSRVVLIPDHGRLLERKLEIRKAIIERPVIDLRRQSDGQWNISRWIGAKPIQLPFESEIEIRDGILRLSCAEGSFPAVQLTGISAEVRVRPPNEVTWIATAAHECAQQLRITGLADVSKRQASFEIATLQSVSLGTVLGYLPESVHARLAAVDHCSGLLDLKLVGQVGVGKAGLACDGELSGNVHSGTLVHRALPYPVTNVQGAFAVSRSRLLLPELRFALGPASGALAVSASDWYASDMVLKADLWELPFSDEVYNLLSARHQQTWERFAPEGTVDLHATITRSENGCQAVGTAQLNGNAVAFYKFPYPVHQVTGNVRLHGDGHISLDVQGRAQDRPVELTGTISRPGPLSAVDVRVSGVGIPYDETLVRAIDGVPGKAGETVRHFAGRAAADFQASVKRDEGQRKFVVEIETDLNCPELVCDWFPYLVHNVTGHLSIKPDETQYSHFVGTSQGAIIKVHGKSVKTTDGLHVETFIGAQRVPLDAKLREALAPHWRKSWDTLNPEGSIDLEATVVNPPGQPSHLHLDLYPERSAVTPQAFPYRLEGMLGKIQFENGTTSWTDVKAHHGTVSFSSSGTAISTADGGGLLTLQNLRCPALPFDADLREAVPTSLREVLDFLRPSRPMAADYQQLAIRWYGDPAQPVRAEFRGTMRTTGPTDMMPAIGAKSVEGAISLAGVSDGQQRWLDGNVHLASITVAGFTGRNLHSPLVIRGERVDVPDIRGDFYGGHVVGNVHAECGQQTSYNCELRAYQARLEEYVAENSPTSDHVGGLVNAAIVLADGGHGSAWPRGTGSFHISQADIYRASVIQDVFRLLNFQAPNGRAFDDVDCEFRLLDGKLLIDRLQMIGPALSLFSFGEGQVDLQSHKLDVHLCPRWVQGRLNIPVISDVFNSASDQLIRVRVAGTLSFPVPSAEPVPGVRDLLEGRLPMINGVNQHRRSWLRR